MGTRMHDKLLGYAVLTAMCALIFFVPNLFSKSSSVGEKAGAGIEECAALTDGAKSTHCVGVRVAKKMNSGSPVAALQDLETVARSNPRIAGVCHQAMHQAAVLADISFDQFSNVVGLRGACASGFTHGMVVQLLANGTAEDLRRAEIACASLADVSEIDRLRARECYHGLGHGLRKKAALSDAIHECSTIDAGRAAKSKCYGGAFMEDTFHRTTRTPLQFHDECAAQKGDARAACFAFVYAKGTTGSDEHSVDQWCDQAGSNDAIAFCYRSVGRAIPGDAGTFCSTLNGDRGQSACIEGFVRGNVYEAFFTKLNDAAALCGGMTSTPRAACTREIGTVIRLKQSRGDKPAPETCTELFEAADRASCADGYRGGETDSLSLSVV